MNPTIIFCLALIACATAFGRHGGSHKIPAVCQEEWTAHKTCIQQELQSNDVNINVQEMKACFNR
jgi:hypothetical protein